MDERISSCAFFKAYSTELPELNCVKKSWRPQPDRRRYSDMSEDENALFEPKVFSPIRKGASLQSYLEDISDEEIRNEMQEHQRRRRLGIDELIVPMPDTNEPIIPPIDTTPISLHENISDEQLDNDEDEAAESSTGFPTGHKSSESAASLHAEEISVEAQQESLKKRAALKVGYDEVNKMQRNFEQRLDQQEESSSKQVTICQEQTKQNAKKRSIKKQRRIAAEKRRKSRLHMLQWTELCRKFNPELLKTRSQDVEDSASSRKEDTAASVASSTLATE